MGSRAWTDEEDAILRAVVAKRLTEIDAQQELAKWGWTRSLEATAHRLRVVRAKLNNSQEDDEMMRYSISRRWM